MGHGATMQSKIGKAVNANKNSASSLKANLQPGDLVFFLDYETMDGIGHCGIYIGMVTLYMHHQDQDIV